MRVKIVKNHRFLKDNTFEITFFGIILIANFLATIVFFINFDMYNFYGNLFLEINTKSEFAIALIKIVLKNTAYLFVLLISGFSAVFQPLIFACGFVKGLEMSVGIISIYSVLGIEGIPVAILFVIVPSLFTIFALTVGARESFFLSYNIAGAIFTEKYFLGLKDAVKLYKFKFFILEIIAFFGALIECIIKTIIQ